MEPKTARRPDSNTKPLELPQQAQRYADALGADAVVLTMDGERAAHQLTPGTRVITRDSGVARVASVTRHAAQVETVLIKAGSLGHRRPPGDVCLPAGARLLIRDWRANALYGRPETLISVHELHDGEFVARGPILELDLIQVTFDSPHILYVDGLEVACQTGAPPL